MNKKTAEKIAAIVLFAVLAIIFVIQNAHTLLTTCPGFLDNGKCLTLEKIPYYDGKQAGLIAFYQVDDSCDSTALSPTDQCIKGYTDAYNGVFLGFLRMCWTRFVECLNLLDIKSSVIE